MSGSETRLVDFAQARVNLIADAIRSLADQVKSTNVHIERLNREMGDVRREVAELRTELRAEMRDGFAAVDTRLTGLQNEVRELRGEVILQANQIINAQQQATRNAMRLDEIEQQRGDPEA